MSLLIHDIISKILII